MKLWSLIFIYLIGSILTLSAKDAPPPSDKMIALLAAEEAAAEEHLSAPPHLLNKKLNDSSEYSWPLIGLTSLLLVGASVYWVFGRKNTSGKTKPVPQQSDATPSSPKSLGTPGQAGINKQKHEIPVPTAAISQADQRFLQQAQALLDKHISDPEFNAEAFCAEMNMSKSQFYRKFQDLKGQSPGKFLREQRLQKAYDMLKNGEGNVSEIAYAVGFNNLSYFAKCFRKEFGMPPSHL